jgi:hypothetical protein
VLAALAVAVILIAAPARTAEAGDGARQNLSDITAQARRARQAPRKAAHRRSGRPVRRAGQGGKSSRRPRAQAGELAPGPAERRALMFAAIPATLTDRTVSDAMAFDAVAVMPPPDEPEPEPEPLAPRVVKTESYRRPPDAPPRADASECRRIANVLAVIILVSAAAGVAGAGLVARFAHAR